MNRILLKGLSQFSIGLIGIFSFSVLLHVYVLFFLIEDHGFIEYVDLSIFIYLIFESSILICFLGGIGFLRSAFNLMMRTSSSRMIRFFAEKAKTFTSYTVILIIVLDLTRIVQDIPIEIVRSVQIVSVLLFVWSFYMLAAYVFIILRAMGRIILYHKMVDRMKNLRRVWNFWVIITLFTISDIAIYYIVDHQVNDQEVISLLFVLPGIITSFLFSFIFGIFVLRVSSKLHVRLFDRLFYSTGGISLEDIDED